MRRPLLPVWVHELPLISAYFATLRGLIAFGVLRAALCADEILHGSLQCLLKRGRFTCVATACGYFDQSHFTREWQALAGCSPKTWIARNPPFLQDYEIGDCENRFHGPASMHKPLV